MGYNLTQINPAYELVSDIIVSSATTSVDFTGLNFGKTDDLILVNQIKNNTSNSGIKVLVNGNTTQTNYWLQSFDIGGTSINASRPNYPLIQYVNNNYNGIGVSKIKLTNNGYVTFQTSITNNVGTSSGSISNYFITTTFTSSSITQLTLLADIANAIGIGSRFQLYKRKAPIIADITVSSATTSIDFTGLTFDKGSEYMLVSDLNNTSASTVSYRLFANNNTTSTNYYTQELYVIGSSVSGGRYNTSIIGGATTTRKSLVISKLKITNNGYFTIQSDGIYDYSNGGGMSMSNYYQTSTFTLTDITQLTITASVANSIGVGSRFQLIKLK